MRNLTWAGFGWRLFFAVVLVFLSYNPSGYSYAHWFSFQPLPVLGGLVLLIGWAIYVRATLRSIGPVGVVLLAALMACFIWLFIDLGWFSLKSVTSITWAVELFIALALGVGMSWSHVRRRLSGQVDADDVDNA